MVSRCTLVFFVTMIVPALLFSQQRVIHLPPNRAVEFQPLQINGLVEATPTPVRVARIYYRTESIPTFKFTPMFQKGERWEGEIPGAVVTGDWLEYLLVFFLEDESLITFPAVNPYQQPHRLMVASARGDMKESPILMLSPLPQTVLTQQDALFAISLETPLVRLDSASLTILVDGVDRTSSAEITEYVASGDLGYLPHGRHEIKIAARSADGVDLNPLTVIFFINDKESAPEKTAQFRGSAFSEGRLERYTERDASFFLGGAEFRGSWKNINVEGRMVVNSLEDAGAQPRHRFYMSVAGSWFQFEAGDVYPRYNELILNGKRVRGLSASLNGGGVQFQTVFGETYRGVEGYMLDSTRVGRYGTLQQQLFGIRPSFSIADKAQLGFSVVKIDDRENSVQIAPFPRSNIVAGPDFILSLDKDRLQVRAHAAYSVLTNNTSLGVFTKQELEEAFNTKDLVDPQIYKNLIIINDTTVPLTTGQPSTLAYEVKVRLNYYQNLFNVGYKMIGSHYNSLANLWLRKNIRGFFISDRLRLWRNKLFINASLERFQDNVMNQGTAPSTDLNSYTVSLSFYPGQAYPYASIYARDYVRTNGISDLLFENIWQTTLVDTFDIREHYQHQDLTVQIGQQLRFWEMNHHYSLSYTYGQRRDHFTDSRLDEYQSRNGETHVRLATWTISYSVPLHTTLSYSWNTHSLAGGLSEYQHRVLSLYGEYQVIPNSLSVFAEVRNTDSQITRDNSVDATTINRFDLRSGATLRLSAGHTITLDAHTIFLSQRIKAVEDLNYTDYIVRLRYEKFFD